MCGEMVLVSSNLARLPARRDFFRPGKRLQMGQIHLMTRELQLLAHIGESCVVGALARFGQRQRGQRLGAAQRLLSIQMLHERLRGSRWRQPRP